MGGLGLLSAFGLLFRRRVCAHAARTTRPLIVHPSGRTYYACYCASCGRRWRETG